MAVHSRARDFDWCGSTKLPPLGLSSVKFIVNKYEADHRITDQQCVNEIDVNCAGSSDVVKFTGNVSVDDISDDEFGILVRDIPIWRRALWCFAIAFSRRIPSVSVGNFGAVAVATSLLAPRMITYFVVYPFCRLVFGTLYPAYASYKAVRTKNLKEYVKWMMYWIVFALFTCAETVTDVFLSWFPFYYEVKIVLVLWLLSPATKGSSILYRKFVHPALCRREQEIDEYISKAKEQGYHTVLNLGSKGVNYATTVIMQTAIKGGGGLVQQIKRSYSLSDLTEGDSRPQSQQDAIDEGDDVITEAKVIRRNTARSGYNTRRSASESNTRSAIYFSEVDVVDVRRKRISDPQDFNYIKSSEDISSGYSSAENSVAALSRTSSVGSKSRPRQINTRSTVTNIKRPAAAEIALTSSATIPRAKKTTKRKT